MTKNKEISMSDKELQNLLLQYKEDMQMSDRAFYKFCNHYYNRNVSTVIWLLSALYGKEKITLINSKSLHTVMKNLCATLML